jgi:hypothetical protein
MMRVKHSDLMDRTKRSAKAFRFGLRAGNRNAVTPALARMLRKDAAKSGSRSKIRNRQPRRNPSAESVRLRAICYIHASPG